MKWLKVSLVLTVFLFAVGIGYLMARQFINNDRCAEHLHVSYSEWNGGDECTIPVHVNGLL